MFMNFRQKNSHRSSIQFSQFVNPFELLSDDCIIGAKSRRVISTSLEIGNSHWVRNLKNLENEE